MGHPPIVMVLPTKSHFLGSISHLKVIGVACGVWIASWFAFFLLSSTGLLGWSGYAAWVGLKAALPVIVLVFSYAIDCRALAWRLPLRVLLHAAYWLALGLVAWISLEGARASAAPEDAGGEAVVIDIICLFAFFGYAAIDGLRGLILTVSRGSEDPPYAYDHGAGLGTVRALLRSRAPRTTRRSSERRPAVEFRFHIKPTHACLTPATPAPQVGREATSHTGALPHSTP